MKVAIIGGGIAGLQLLQEFQDEHECLLFESKPTLGGIWSDSYSNQMSLQISPRIYRFPSDNLFPRSRNGQDVHQYITNFAYRKNLLQFIYSNSRVIHITRQGDQFNILVKHLETGQNRNFTHFNWVICTGNTSHPRIPSILTRQTIHPPYLHTAHLNDTIIDNTRGKKVIVMGGSKSAAEAVLRFYPNNHVIWIARRFNSFAKSQPHTTVSLYKLAQCLVNSGGQEISNCITEYNVHPGQKPYSGSFNFLNEVDQHILFRKVETVEDNIRSVFSHSILLESGRSLRCDLLICGTGFYQNKCPFNNIQDNRLIPLKPSSLQKYTNTSDYSFFSHFCGYTILIADLKDYIKTDNYLRETFSEYHLRQKGILNKIYPIEYYVRSSLLPRAPIAPFSKYRKKRKWIVCIICLVSFTILVIFAIRRLLPKRRL